MREIEFRAWTSDTKEMIPWEEAMFPEWFDDPAINVMQYTGLKDKNGKKIFEGDTLKAFHFKEPNGRKHFLSHYVIWNSDLHGWFAVNSNNKDKSHIKTGNIQMFVYMKYSHPEVIGNIHENPRTNGSE